MATPSNLIESVARALGVPEATVSSHYRALREAGLVSKAGRGRGSAKMTTQDAANLLIAVAGSSALKNAIETVTEIVALPVVLTFGGKNPIFGKWTTVPIPLLQALPAKHTFGQVFAALIQAAADGSLLEARAHLPANKRFIEISFLSPGSNAMLRFFEESGKNLEGAQYSSIPYDKRSSQNVDELKGHSTTPKFYGDLTQKRSFSENTIIAVAELLRK
ncbi:ArsR/SmtB family transcription factor [Methylocella tundrae]|uniref:HTH arsR-type domain-containing protein n=1 Tax=Methylocella tundrae TaxID=227605 RepID=A0A4U8YZ38_METTU|nr:helix-turn-helix domain-containing protein [Methylocella tundrae]WPP05877.1 helix-turn-helix domain-containing protein [Methylocella tundrae]VFU08405.1 conserved protein of unknown function [Methylocella tundrae]